MKHRIVVVVVVVGLVVGAVACTPRNLAEDECRDPARPQYPVPAGHTVPWPSSSLFLANDTTIDAVGRSFVHDVPVPVPPEDQDEHPYGYHVGVKIHRPAAVGSQRVNLCLLGGSFYTTLNPETEPWDLWHDSFAINTENPSPTVVGATLFNTGDGIVFNYRADNWKVVGVRADGGGLFPGAYIHDDCIENDSMHTGSVVDSKFDGCHVFLSSTIGAGTDGVPGPDGSNDTVTIENVIVRLQPFQNSYKTDRYGTNKHGGFFKWANPDDDEVEDGIPPKLVVKNSIFRANQPASYGGNASGGLGLPPGTICENVVLVGTEAWPATQVDSWRDQCNGLRLGDLDDWNEAVSTWDEAHPPMTPPA